jgi:hypothetical protein
MLSFMAFRVQMFQSCHVIQYSVCGVMTATFRALVSEWVAFETSAAQFSNRIPPVHTLIWTLPSRATWSTQQPTASEPCNTGTHLVSMSLIE